MTVEPGAVEQALIDLGLSTGAARLYPRVLDRVAPSAEDAEPLAELVALGLAAEVDGFVEALEPGPALRVLGDRVLAETDRAAAALTASYRRLARADDPGVVDLDRRSAEDELGRALAGARASVAVLDTPPLLRAEEKIDTGPGVEVRVVHSAAALRLRDEAAATGHRARVLAEVPVKLVLVDGATAFLTTEADDGGLSTALARSGPVVAAVTALFEACWRAAVAVEPGGESVRASDRKLLELLDSGLPDEAVCRVLGIGRRTLYRRLEILMARTGAKNRFQLAARAVRSGLI